MGLQKEGRELVAVPVGRGGLRTFVSGDAPHQQAMDTVDRGLERSTQSFRHLIRRASLVGRHWLKNPITQNKT